MIHLNEQLLAASKTHDQVPRLLKNWVQLKQFSLTNPNLLGQNPTAQFQQTILSLEPQLYCVLKFWAYDGLLKWHGNPCHKCTETVAKIHTTSCEFSEHKVLSGTHSLELTIPKKT